MQRGNLVAREGSAPSNSGCRPDVMLLGFHSLAKWMPQMELFAIANRNHHRAVEARPAKVGCPPGFAPGLPGSKPGMLRLHHEAVEARIAKLVARRGNAPRSAD